MNNKVDIPINDPKTIILFSKMLKKTDLTNQLILATEFVRQPLIRDEESLICLDNYGHAWKFPLYKREDEKNPKPTIPPAPWQKFVKEYRLQGGDAVVFYTREDDPNKSIQIRGMRKRQLPFAPHEQWVELTNKPAISK